VPKNSIAEGDKGKKSRRGGRLHLRKGGANIGLPCGATGRAAKDRGAGPDRNGQPAEKNRSFTHQPMGEAPDPAGRMID